MSNQKKNIAELGYALHGYPADIPPKTLNDIDNLAARLTASLNNVVGWDRAMSVLFTLPLDEFINIKYDCCLVPSSVSDFPADLREEDNNAYLFTNRNASDGVQILIGAQSGYQYTRRLNNGVLTEWDVVQGSTIYYAVFDIDLSTGELSMHTDPGYSGANFTIENGNLIVTI